MILGSVYYLGVTVLMFAIFACIVVRTYARRNRELGEQPKFRMLDDHEPLHAVEKVTKQEATHVR